MKGDLHTLKKVCMYASKVMLAGTAVLGAIIAVLIVLGVGSFFSDTLSEILQNVLDCRFGTDPAEDVAASYCEVLLIFVLALITVFTTYGVTVSIRSEHSPFVDSNVSLVKNLSATYLAFAFVFLVLELTKGKLANMTFMFFGCVLISVVLYMFALIIRYGGLLQDESDHTL